MVKTSNFYHVLTLLMVFLFAVSVFAQDVQEQYNQKLKEANDVVTKMRSPDITKTEYDELNAKYLSLQEELKKLKQVLESDVEYTKKINDSKIAFNDGNTAYKKGQYESAISFYQKAIDLNSNNPKAYYGEGLALTKLRRYEEAIGAFEKAVELSPSYDEAYAAMGSTYDDIGKLDEAIASYQKAVEINPTSKTSIYNLGGVYKKAKDNRNAIKYFQLATQVDPEYYRAFSSLGTAYFDDGQVDNAIMAFQNALALKPDYVESSVRLAMAYNNIGKHEDALHAAQECLKKPGRMGGFANYEAGMALKNLGRTNEAIAYFEQASQDRQWRQPAQYEIDLLKKKQ
ncbi:hypothetical protein A2V82_05095 [candidate division KSB1 bacterium RBG_16_48_16]|nr:MAG: hypothetical protein A2V82_05095 [candidate division KSB1 bacterium RBG_16_48_16]